MPFEIKPGLAYLGMSGERSSVKVSNGWIIGFNAGEFGAGLWWYSLDGKKRQWITEAWVKEFLLTDAGLLVVEGLAHGITHQGRILRLSQDATGRWQSEDFLDLGHAPYVAMKDADGSLLVATTDRLLRVVPTTKKVEVLLDDVFWGGLRPKSLIITRSGVIYLGMKRGVAKVARRNGVYKAFWLLPNQEFVDSEPREEAK